MIKVTSHALTHQEAGYKKPCKSSQPWVTPNMQVGWWTHQSTASVWADCLTYGLTYTARKELRHRYSNTIDRPDIVTFDSISGMNFELEISSGHHWSWGEIFPASAEKDGAEAKRREEMKRTKYAKYTETSWKCFNHHEPLVL